MTDTIRIPLGPSGVPTAWATVDFADYERLIMHRWYMSGRGYAFRTNEGKSVFMHREVLGFPQSEAVNHVNGDKLDNRRANLEACTHQHNVRVGDRATAYQRRDRIRDLRLDGWTNRAIADEVGLSVASVVKYASDLPRASHPSLRWTEEALVAAVRDFHATTGRVPALSDFRGKGGMPWFVSVYRRFASLRDLIEAAGFEYVDGRRGQRTAA